MKYLLLLLIAVTSYAGPYKINKDQIFQGGKVSTNFVINPNAEKNSALGLSISGLTFTRTTTNPIGGMADFTITATNSGQYVRWNLNAPHAGLKGKNCEARASFTGDGTKYNFELVSSTAGTLSSVAFTNETYVRDISINYPCGDLTDTRQVQVISTAAGATFRVANVYYGEATNIGTETIITPWQSYNVTISATTTAPTRGTVNENAYWRRVGDSIEIWYRLDTTNTSGSAVGSGIYLFSLPNGFVADTTKVNLITGPTGGGTVGGGITGFASGSTGLSTVVFLHDTTHLRLSTIGTDGISNGVGSSNYALSNGSLTYYYFNAKIPVVGLSAQTAVRVDQSNFGTRTTTPTISPITGFTNGPTMRYYRDGEYLHMSFQFLKNTSAGTGATALTIALPENLQIDSTKIISGVSGTTGALAGGFDIWNSAYHYSARPAYNDATTIKFVKQGSGTYVVGTDVGASDSMEGWVKVPIVGWTNNQNAPLLVGSVFPGAVMAYASTTCPEGWFIADGTAISRTQYASLFSAIGTTWGAGDSSTTFNLPDLRGAFLRGTGTGTINSRNKVGPSVGEKQEDQFQGHRHNVDPNGNSIYELTDTTGSYTFAGGNKVFALISSTGNPVTDTVNGPQRTGTETIPYNVGVTYCVRY